jgi:hypothetical protein
MRWLRLSLQFSGDGDAGSTEFRYQAFVVGCARPLLTST